MAHRPRCGRWATRACCWNCSAASPITRPSMRWSRRSSSSRCRPTRSAVLRRSPSPIVEDAERLTERLRLSNAESAELVSMAHRWWRLVSIDEAQARVRLYKLGPDRYRRSPDAGLGAKRRRCGPLAAARDASRALDRAGVSVEGGRLHGARPAARTGARRGARPRRAALDRCGISVRRRQSWRRSPSAR